MYQRNLTILYGSQTGTAQDLAEKLYRESKQYHFIGPVLSMDNYDVQKLIEEKIVLFVCSTTGQGDEPDNMKKFWKFLLRRNLPTDSLNNVQFGVLGLGDSSYLNFNFVAKRLSKRLKQLGGTEIIATGLCDDQHDLGIYGVCNTWITNLWDCLLKICPLPNGLNKLPEIPRQFKWDVTTIDDNNENNAQIKLTNNIYDDCIDPVFDKPFYCTVLNNIRTTSESHYQDVRLISFNIPDGLTWAPGDVFLTRPINSNEQVDNLFEILRDICIYPETVISVKEFSPEIKVPKHLENPLSLWQIAKQLWDLNAIPRQRTFELLALNCKDELEKEKLIEFTTAEGQQDLFSYANRPRRTILEVLVDFPHSLSKLNLPTLFELFESIKPRSFSIASAFESKRLDILVAVVKYKTILVKPRLGLCSNWLKSLKVSDRIYGVIKRGTMKLPNLANNNDGNKFVLVGPGTGLAPFRSLLQASNIIGTQNKFLLFFGCRNENGDFHCKDELKTMEKNGFLTVITAFSRDQDDKCYVQHKIKENQKLLKKYLIENNGYFLVCGSSKNMPKAVKDALIETLGDNEFVEQMIKNGRYQEETWS